MIPYFCILSALQQKGTYAFSKSSRLKSRKKLQQVFSTGRRLYSGNVKLLCIREPAEKPAVYCGVGTSSRHFRKAVDRNRIKRLLREAYRLQQYPLKELAAQTSSSYSLFFLFTGKEIPLYSDIYKQIGRILEKLANGNHEVAH